MWVYLPYKLNYPCMLCSFSYPHPTTNFWCPFSQRFFFFCKLVGGHNLGQKLIFPHTKLCWDDELSEVPSFFNLRVTILDNVISLSPMEIISLKTRKSEKHRKWYSKWCSKWIQLCSLWSIWDLSNALFCTLNGRGGYKRDILYPQILTVYLRQQTENIRIKGRI